MVWTTLIAPDALAECLTDPSVVVVDCRYDLADPSWGLREYEKQHIPGAVFASIDDDLSGVKTGRNGRHPLPEIATLPNTLGRLGIASDTQAIAYDQDAGMYASRLWWLLRWMGHDEVAVLDGGFAKWRAEGRPTTACEEPPRPRDFSGSPRADMLADVGEVATLVGDQGWLLLDARAPERYRGDIEPIDRVPGHIPGAVNHHFLRNVDERGAFRSAEALRQDLQQVLGQTPADRVVCYCGSGVTACQNLVALEHIGLHGARLYPGSWSEWS